MTAITESLRDRDIRQSLAAAERYEAAGQPEVAESYRRYAARLSQSRLCACGQPTGSMNWPTCRACLHAEIAANTVNARARQP